MYQFTFGLAPSLREFTKPLHPAVELLGLQGIKLRVCYYLKEWLIWAFVSFAGTTAGRHGPPGAPASDLDHQDKKVQTDSMPDLTGMQFNIRKDAYQGPDYILQH